jgi:RND family efflux transporter MFP subunit
LWGLLAILGCGRSEPAAVVEAPPVATASVSAVDLEEAIVASGELEARHHVVVAAEVSGRVTRVLREEGDTIEADEPVLEIDPKRRQLEVEAAEARLAQVRAQLRETQRQNERVSQLFASKAVSRSKLDEAETALQMAESDVAAQRAQLGVAQQALADATVRAPFAGVVGRRQVGEGEFVQVGTPLVEFVSLDPIEVIFHLAEIDSGRVAEGQRVQVSVAPHPGEVFEAEVDVVYPTIDPVSRTLRVKATLRNPERKLRPGLFARAHLGIRERRGVPMVPEEAVLQRSDGAVVFRLRDAGRVERRVVEIGEFRDGRVEVRRGVSAGDVVVTRGHTDLVDGAVVRVVSPSGAGPAVAGRGDAAAQAGP